MKTPVLIGLVALASVLGSHRGLTRDTTTRDTTAHAASSATVSVCFVPAQTCVDDIVAAIGSAKSRIHVQAYGFTAPTILQALGAAKRRGVEVAVILDKINASKRYSGATYVTSAGIPVLIDTTVQIAHNKVIIIDDHLVIGGSYNYTKSAETRNAENVTFIDSSEAAKLFEQNWQSRKQVSSPYAGPSGSQGPTSSEE